MITLLIIYAAKFMPEFYVFRLGVYLVGSDVRKGGEFVLELVVDFVGVG